MNNIAQNQPHFSLTTMKQYWLGKTKPKQGFEMLQSFAIIF